MMSATVIAPTALDNEAFAKALCLLDPKTGIALINKQGKRYASIIVQRDKQGRISVHTSANYADFRIRKSK
jgi:thiamine biosynthesis lipoprotein ApbE